MIDIFDKKPIDLTKVVCHSGGAFGADTVWENEGETYSVITRAYSHKTPKHTSPNKVEISDDVQYRGVVVGKNNQPVEKSEEITVIVNKEEMIKFTTSVGFWHIRELGNFNKITHVRVDNNNKIIYEISFDNEFREIFKNKSYILETKI
jgi:hypothetical protein